MQKSKHDKFIYLLFYNVFNAFLLSIILRGIFIIHSDGPAGFAELIIKIYVFWVSVFLFACRERAGKPRSRLVVDHDFQEDDT